MKRSFRFGFFSLSLVLVARLAVAQEPNHKSAPELLVATVNKLVSLLETPAEAEARTFSVRLEVTKSEGLPRKLPIQGATLAFQAPDRLRLDAKVGGDAVAAGRDGQELWAHLAAKKWGVLGQPGLPRFASNPELKDTTKLGPVKFPLPKEQLALLPLLLNVERLAIETNDQVRCVALKATPKPEAIDALKIPRGEIRLAVRETDFLPARLSYSDGKKIHVEILFHEPTQSEAWPAQKWKMPTSEGDRIETTAVGHLTKFLSVALGSLGDKIPTLGPPTGDRRVIATEGDGRFERIDGTRVLFLKGTPEEMGRQQGALLKKEVKNLVDRILYGVGVGSSFAKGRWFFGEIEHAQGRLAPFMDTRYVREMDALAVAAGLAKEEVRLANYFPELFHCSGFALYGSATKDGKVYHGRILDYLRGLGLEQNAVVVVVQPDQGNAWVNVGYAGFIGSVTAMNEKHVAIGEMGGRGEGHWDGKPMAQLVREVMEKANTIDEAVEIMRRGPRTCEYYYVISDAKSKRAVGVAATPDKFETVWAGESHPRLPHAIKDAVLMSAGDRYEELARRVKSGHGTFTADTARDLMTKPVCMGSNIHSVLFDPETLDFWVANADSQNVASHTRYTRYNLAELLKPRQ